MKSFALVSRRGTGQCGMRWIAVIGVLCLLLGCTREEQEVEREGPGPAVASNIGKAEAMLKAMIEEDPEDVRAYFGLGAVYLAQRRYEEAIKAYERILALDSTYVDAYDRLGFVLELHRSHRDP